MTQQDFEPKLSFVVLNDDNKAILLNGNPDYSLALPLNFSKKKAKERQKIVESLVYNGCASYGLNYVSQDNVRNLAKEVVNQSFERRRVVKQLSVSDVIRKHSGRVETTVKIIGVSPPDKMISHEVLTCPVCGYSKEYEFKPPRSPYKVESKKCPKKCSINGIDQIDLIAQFEYINTKNITVQAPDVRQDLEKLRVVLFEDYGRNVKVGETATIIGDVYTIAFGGNSGKKLYAVLYAESIKYEREEEKPITKEDVKEFKKFAENPNIIDELVTMFAPQVIGHSDAKLGTLRSAVNVLENKHVTGIRSRTHTLFAGDPGTAKSMLADEGTKIVPNSRYVTAQHLSVKSALAIVDKEMDGSKMLTLGAVPQASNAICSINEMGSMAYEDQQHLADVLEEGRFTIEKYGIYQEISSPTTIIATTNPEGGYWSKSVPPSLDQVPIKSNIRDRFDQVYIFEDFQTQEERREYAIKKMKIYQNPQELKIDYDFLKRYLQYAAAIPSPVLTPEASTMLSDFWIRMTEAGYATNRSFDSLVRIARAQARLHLKEEIDAAIVNEVTKSVQLMFVKMGVRIDPTIENPVDLAYFEIIQYVNTLEVPTTFEEALKHVCKNSNSIKQYVGIIVGDKSWSIASNKRVRSIHDRFSDGGVGSIKVGRGELAIAIHKVMPLTLVKTQKQTPQQQLQDPKSVGSNRSNRSISDTVTEQYNREMCEIDKIDKIDLSKTVLKLVEKTMVDRGYFTKEDFKTTLMFLPVQDPLHCNEYEADKTLRALKEEGKIIEFEPDKYKPSGDLAL